MFLWRGGIDSVADSSAHPGTGIESNIPVYSLYAEFDACIDTARQILLVRRAGKCIKYFACH